MRKRRFFKKLGQDLGWWALRAIYQSTRRASLEQLRRRAERLGGLAYRWVGSRRRLMQANLRLILPEASAEQIDRIARQTVQNIFQGLLDLFYLCWHLEEAPKLVELHVSPRAEEAIRSERGIVAATGHLGLFPLVIFPHNWQGRPCAAMVKDPHDVRVARFLSELRAQAGVGSINHQPPTTAARKTVGLLQRRGVVLFAFDLYPGKAESVEVNFLGRRTRMFSAPVRFAARVGAVIVPSYVIKRSEGIGYEVHLEDPIHVPAVAGRRESPVTVELVQQLADWIAEKIRAYPDQWWSIHRRWRKE